MPFASALSTRPTTRSAVAEVMTAREKLPGPPDLAVVFWSPDHGELANELAAQLVGGLEAKCLIGCQGESIIGVNREIESGPALSLWLAHWEARSPSNRCTSPLHKHPTALRSLAGPIRWSKPIPPTILCCCWLTLLAFPLPTCFCRALTKTARVCVFTAEWPAA